MRSRLCLKTAYHQRSKYCKDYLGIEGDEESSMFEDSVSPAK